MDPAVEPRGYLEWRRLFSTDFEAAIATGNAPGKDHDKMLFMCNTEFRLSDKGLKSPIYERVIFAWDEDQGVWVLEASEASWEALKVLLGRDFLHWHEALERCGAVYYQDWRECPWSRAAAEQGRIDGYRPFFMDKADLKYRLKDTAGEHKEEPASTHDAKL
ncbi:hypothetical protein Asppvi_000125 [Aspergillus pseudoviridinutans]|uniref:Uncharacterized protein n=1 Tax=Aspergillus pseudoviridinutans TaxID=1517512 RepID=A0A9P3ENU4_9EURO|nr:uncharacterized protein Asppvi_000125 [Aspergillus pseudoviridinutans]GIJ81626.1 hypothetical protein Asppvi_000125 [Aspergillus pseudoviridinutans]